MDEYTVEPIDLSGWGPKVLAQFQPRARWNGFIAAPRIDALSVVRVLDAVNAEPDSAEVGYDWEFRSDGTLLLVDRQYRAEYPDNPADYIERLYPDEDGLYALGGYGWAWSEAD